jgi:Spy/CpxP family protein refolding chaperone
MRWLNLVGSLTALLAGVAVANVAFAQHPMGGPRPGGGPDRFIEEHAAQLGLDDQTRQSIDQIVDESRVRARELRVELRGMHQEMRDLLSQQTPDEAAVMQQAEAIGQTETALHKHRLETLIKIRALLTDEQRAELMEIREETRAQWLQPLIDACEGDVEQFCPDAKDPWTRKRCLRQRWDEVSPDCQGAIEAAKGEGRRGRRKGGRSGNGEL